MVLTPDFILGVGLGCVLSALLIGVVLLVVRLVGGINGSYR